ncbi:Tetratricopeptide repeat-containing protein [Nonomuraea maritima]|uniref:Tetratricopeptide repeat-containing protein n=1 Tax=Nonomuraea maritima TaxID=683260 RepID=A0A1G8XZ46_9ACTN|nr:CHAT domain-containing tetratricopeptide repeat protein [Nonomuraea maritima]SDJ95798.1 Tetratricopeptide repeat-containing protein [Nonomuraea maritima]
MTDPAGALAARIERFEQTADPELIWDPAALAEAEQAMRACAGDRSDAATWRLIGVLHLARHRLDRRAGQDADVAGAFFAAVALADPDRLPDKLRGNREPGTWAGLAEEVLGHVDPGAYPHVGLLVQALVQRALDEPDRETADRLAELLLPESARTAAPWVAGALAPLGSGLLRLYERTGERDVLDDAVHVLLRTALGGHTPAARSGELAAALALAAPGDAELVRTYLAAADTPARSQDRSQALLALVDLTQARSAASYADRDLLAFIRAGQCALDFWHEEWAHPGVLAPYAAGLLDWFVVTGDERSLEAGTEMLEALHVKPGETVHGLGTDPVVRLALLGERRLRRHEITGDVADLDTAVDALREAVTHAPSTHPRRAGLLARLAGALLTRVSATGGDPAEPIAAARAAARVALGARDPGRAETLLLLGRALTLDLTEETADEAVAALREALAMGERVAVRAEAYGLVSEVLRWRATRTGLPSREEDLDEAVRSARQGADLAAKAGSDPVPARAELCRALVARCAVRHDPGDLAEALTLARDLTDAPGELFAELDTALDDPPPVDEQLARAATELALRCHGAVELAVKLLRLSERGTPDERGEHLLGAGLRLAESGHSHIATRVLECAARAFGAAERHAQAAHALARQAAGHEDLGEFAAALEAYARSAAAYRHLGDPRSEAIQLGNMGVVHLRAGDPVRAVEAHLRAVELCRDAGFAAEEATHQGSAAEAYVAAGDPAGAVACAVRARDLYLELGDREAAALQLAVAARAAVEEDDLTAAGERMAACAMELEAAGAWEDACRALDAYAVLLAGRGHRARAAAAEARLVEIVRRRGARREPADEWYRVAQRRRLQGDTAAARLAFEQALGEYEHIGHDDGVGAVSYNLGALAYAEGDARHALADFGTAAQTYARLRAPAKEAAALTMRAACLARVGRTDDAVADVDRALELAAAEGDLETLFTATLGRATLDARRGELREAGERLHAALGLAGADPLKEAVVHERLAAHAALVGDAASYATELERAATLFRACGQPREAALTSIRLGFALEVCGNFTRARTVLETALTELQDHEPSGDDRAGSRDGEPPQVGRAGVRDGASPAGGRSAVGGRQVADGMPFELVVAMAGGPEAEVLARLAAMQLTLGSPVDGRATLTQALAALRAGGGGDRGAAERLEIRLRMEEAEASGDLERARALAEQALTAFRPHPPARGVRHLRDAGGRGVTRLPAAEPDDRSYLLAKLSSFCRALGDLPAAYEYAARGCERHDERLAEHLSNLGAVAAALNRTDEAAEHLTEAVSVARETASALPVQLVRSLGLLGRALTDLARWEEAAQAYEEGLALTRAPVWRALRAPLLAGRATLHLRLGELDAAEAAFLEAVTVGEELGDPAPLSDAYADLALIHEVRGDPAGAVPYATRALTLARTRPDTVLALLTLARLASPPHPRTSQAAGPERRPNPDPSKRPPGADHPERLSVGRAVEGAVERAGVGHVVEWPGVGRAEEGADVGHVVERPGVGRAEEGAGVGRVVEWLEEALVLARESGFRAGEALALRHLAALDPAAPHARLQLTMAIDILTELGYDLELAAAFHHRSIGAEQHGDLGDALADAERAAALGHPPARRRVVRLAVRLDRPMTAWTHADAAAHDALSAAHDAQPGTHTLLSTTHAPISATHAPSSTAHSERHSDRHADGHADEHADRHADGRGDGHADRRGDGREGPHGALRNGPEASGTQRPPVLHVVTTRPTQPPALHEDTAHGRGRSTLRSVPEEGRLTLRSVPAGLAEAEQRAAETVRSLLSAARLTRDPGSAARLVRSARAAEADLEALWRRMEPLAPEHVALRRGTPLDLPTLEALVAHPDGQATGLLAFHVDGQEKIAFPPHGQIRGTARAEGQGEGTSAGRGQGEGTSVVHSQGERAFGGHGHGAAVDGSGGGALTAQGPGDGVVTVLAYRSGWAGPRGFVTSVTRSLLADFLATADGRSHGHLDIAGRRHRAETWQRTAAMLLADPLRALGDDLDRLVLVPYAGLRDVPLHALAPDGGQLIERFPVTYGPSAATLARLIRRPPAEGTGCLVLGSSAAPREARDVAALHGVHPHLAEDATADLLNGSWNVVHLACPIECPEEDPFGSGVRLADGLLTARDIMTMSVDARLVVLTTREPVRPEASVPGGVGPHRAVGGVAALGQALLHAGARAVVLPLWPVSAEVAQAFALDLHTRLRDGTGPAEAVRAAALGLRELYGPAEPGLWAPYVLVGLPH